MPSTVLLTKDTAMKKADKNVYHLVNNKITHYFVLFRREILNKYIYIYTHTHTHILHIYTYIHIHTYEI